MAYEGMELTEWMDGVPAHPVATLFPMLPESELQELADDIKANGQHEPIVIAYLDEMMMDEPVVIDGRNRFAACQLAGVEPKIRNDYTIKPAEIGPWIMSHNRHRRHLSQSQKAAVAVGYEKWLSEDAKVRIDQGRKNSHISRRGGLGVEKFPQPNGADDLRSRASEQAGDILGVSGRAVRDAKYVAQNDPEAFQRVRDGKQAVSAAAREIRDRINPKPELTPEQLAEKKLRPLLKENEAVIEAAFLILAEVLGKEV